MKISSGIPRVAVVGLPGHAHLFGGRRGSRGKAPSRTKPVSALKTFSFAVCEGPRLHLASRPWSRPRSAAASVTRGAAEEVGFGTKRKRPSPRTRRCQLAVSLAAVTRFGVSPPHRPACWVRSHLNIYLGIKSDDSKYSNPKFLPPLSSGSNANNPTSSGLTWLALPAQSRGWRRR